MPAAPNFRDNFTTLLASQLQAENDIISVLESLISAAETAQAQRHARLTSQVDLVATELDIVNVQKDRLILLGAATEALHRRTSLSTENSVALESSFSSQVKDTGSNFAAAHRSNSQSPEYPTSRRSASSFLLSSQRRSSNRSTANPLATSQSLSTPDSPPVRGDSISGSSALRRIASSTDDAASITPSSVLVQDLSPTHQLPVPASYLVSSSAAFRAPSPESESDLPPAGFFSPAPEPKEARDPSLLIRHGSRTSTSLDGSLTDNYSFGVAPRLEITAAADDPE